MSCQCSGACCREGPSRTCRLWPLSAVLHSQETAVGGSRPVRRHAANVMSSSAHELGFAERAVFCRRQDSAEFGRIGRYYATESMPGVGRGRGALCRGCHAQLRARPLEDFFARAVQEGGLEGQELRGRSCVLKLAREVLWSESLEAGDAAVLLHQCRVQLCARGAENSAELILHEVDHKVRSSAGSLCKWYVSTPVFRGNRDFAAFR